MIVTEKRKGFDMSEFQDSGGARQALTAATFVTLIDTLVDDFDVIDVLTVLASRCVELLGASAAGILLADPSGDLRVMAASTEQIELLELFQIQNQQGPCMDCYRTGHIIVAPDLATDANWPQFATESIAAGYPSVCAVPLRLRSVVLGCLNLFMSDAGPLSDADVHLAQSLADVASIAIVQDQAARDAMAREGRLQHALDSRIAIEQAKGKLSEYAGLDMDAAFGRLRTFARNNNRGLTEVAELVVSGAIAIGSISAAKSGSTSAPSGT
jgi:transcriptional regulator with GAF, ATPase, and Fis domain